MLGWLFLVRSRFRRLFASQAGWHIVSPNPSIQRTFHRPPRALWLAAHAER
jgi:hypothetical protein